MFTTSQPSAPTFNIRPRLRSWAIILGIGVALAVTGCGSSAGPIAENGAASYIGWASNAVAVIQWTRTGNTVTGRRRYVDAAKESV